MTTKSTKTKTPASPEEIRRQRDVFLTKWAEIIRKNQKEEKQKTQ